MSIHKHTYIYIHTLYIEKLINHKSRCGCGTLYNSVKRRKQSAQEKKESAKVGKEIMSV